MFDISGQSLNPTRQQLCFENLYRKYDKAMKLKIGSKFSHAIWSMEELYQMECSESGPVFGFKQTVGTVSTLSWRLSPFSTAMGIPI